MNRKEVPWMEMIVGKGKSCKIDVEDIPKIKCALSRYSKKISWTVCKHDKRFYVRSSWSNGRQTLLHDFIMATPHGMVCHHINGDTMDNRKKNLINMSNSEHSILHHRKKI